MGTSHSYRIVKRPIASEASPAHCLSGITGWKGLLSVDRGYRPSCQPDPLVPTQLRVGWVGCEHPLTLSFPGVPPEATAVCYKWHPNAFESLIHLDKIS